MDKSNFCCGLLIENPTSVNIEESMDDINTEEPSYGILETKSMGTLYCHRTYYDSG